MKLFSCWGVWAVTVSGDIFGWPYKYLIETQNQERIYKADPFAFYSELRPGTASRAFGLDGYQWNDEDWMRRQKEHSLYAQPMSIYEVHLPSFVGEINYRSLAKRLVPYVRKMGYTHVEFMPVAEYPLDASWGYQITGFYSVTGRGGSPYDFMALIDALHAAGIGVILDWVIAHFPRDDFGLRLFDGTPCYEYANPLEGEHPEWGTMVFNYARNEVRSFLLSNALFWAEVYHVDGLRADAVSSMLYRSYGRKDGEWIRNCHGGAENLEAISLLQRCSERLFERFPGFIFAAEESTAFPLVTRPANVGGLGFNYKWNMGWMNDILEYMSMDPVYRKHHHNKLTFSMMYAFSENYILAISHDEVVHGKKSLLDKMPGDYWQKFANLRVFFAYMFAHPGKKLLFMSGEIGQFIEWRFYESVEWKLLAYPAHKELQQFVKRLNAFYRTTVPLYEIEDSWEGFAWNTPDDSEHSVIAFTRRSKSGHALLCVFNFTPVVWENYRLGVPGGSYKEVINSDDAQYGGSGVCNEGKITSRPVAWNGYAHSIEIRLPPLGGVYFTYKPTPQKRGRGEQDKTTGGKANAI